MIVKLTAPKGVISVRYGATEMLVSDDGTIDVPRYVAKTLVASAHFSHPEDLSAIDVAAELEAGDPWEAQYMLHAHGKQARTIPLDKRVAAAKEVFAAKGEPKASAA